jgi:hypothetical protein
MDPVGSRTTPGRIGSGLDEILGVSKKSGPNLLNIGFVTRKYL